ncbi:hypothetical protein [Kerstersia gyiorum]|uniref:hypothetical protein n=1 Tax=Kerstersia gyiorum TaxID=206506 RepID=UPI0020A090E0|nr:hypothetical protein [Kerstersia gyiorum]MCP1679433.1 hypothetical protein [Kerstersia gyiorum]MCP1823936.1 hypothetical protein [Kerstersia gyiorum]MCP1827377.1 hypothetical protein [Kerstersia gyiorum]MCW2448974.1 hypothetical protein [Kerstersia gyiorum]
MSTELSSKFLQGQILALTYAIRTLADYHHDADGVFEAIHEQLEGVSNSMLEHGNRDAADGVSRIQAALGAGRDMND